MTLEEYFRAEYQAGKIDFSLRVECSDGVRIYVHPTNKDGVTTPMLQVQGNTVCLAPGSVALERSAVGGPDGL